MERSAQLWVNMMRCDGSMYVCMYMLYAHVSYFTNVHICIMGTQSWDGAQTAQNILDLDGNPMFVGIWGPNLSTNSSLELHFQRNRSATPPPMQSGHWTHWHSRHGHWHWHGWHAISGGLSSSWVGSRWCAIMPWKGGFYWAKMRQTSLFHTVNGNIYGEPVRLHRFEVGTSRCQGWNTCTHRVQFSFRQACYMMLWTMIWTLIVW